MSEVPLEDVRARLDAWRADGAHSVDPLRFALLESLARRGAALKGPARARLQARLAQLAEDYGERVAVSGAATDAMRLADAAIDAGHDGTGHAEQANPLARLLADLAAHASARARARGHPAAGGLAGAANGVHDEIPALESVRQVWARLSAERQLRQSSEQVPPNAGPLHSSVLVHRALMLMREVSPGYLRQFMAYIDALAWMEQVDGARAAGPSGRRKTVRGRAP